MISRKCLKENPLGFRRRQHCRGKPTVSICSVDHKQLFSFFVLPQQRIIGFHYLVPFSKDRAMFPVSCIEELLLLPSIPPSKEDSPSSSEVLTWPLTFEIQSSYSFWEHPIGLYLLNMQTQYRLQFCSLKSGHISILSDTWSRASLGREEGDACKRSTPGSQGCFLTTPTLSKGEAAINFCPLTDLFNISCFIWSADNRTQEWNAHLATWPGAYPPSQQSFALRRRARRRDESSGEFSGKACDVLPTRNPSVEMRLKHLFAVLSPFYRGYPGYSSLWWVIMGCNLILI